MEEVFEFVPKFKATKEMTFSELMKQAGITEASMNRRLKKFHLVRGRKFTKAECNLILNEKSDITNWNIKGYYPIIEIAKKLGLSQTTITSRLKKYNIPTIYQEIRLKGYIWVSDSNYKKLKDYLDQEKNKYTSCSDIADKYSVNLRRVQKLAVKLNLPYVIKNQSTKQHLFTSINAKKLETELVKSLKIVATAKKKSAEELYYDKMFKLHPLVKDKKFFNVNYFPDPTPWCFQDMD